MEQIIPLISIQFNPIVFTYHIVSYHIMSYIIIHQCIICVPFTFPVPFPVPLPRSHDSCVVSWKPRIPLKWNGIKPRLHYNLSTPMDHYEMMQNVWKTRQKINWYVIISHDIISCHMATYHMHPLYLIHSFYHDDVRWKLRILLKRNGTRPKHHYNPNKPMDHCNKMQINWYVMSHILWYHIPWQHIRGTILYPIHFVMMVLDGS